MRRKDTTIEFTQYLQEWLQYQNYFQSNTRKVYQYVLGQALPYMQKIKLCAVNELYLETDGAFIPSAMIQQSETGKTEYFETYIAAKNKDRLTRRNISKRKIVYYLAKADCIAGFPYEIYFFSRNMEHVLHGISEDLSDDEKEDLAFEIADRYSDRPMEFLKSLYDISFHVPGTYSETWKFIMENGNSLKRYCNVSLFFEKLGISIEE